MPMNMKSKIKINKKMVIKTCPLVDFCNYSKKCWDEDWKNCGVYIGATHVIKECSIKLRNSN
ncbi:hypothetical protein LCGC14_2404380 [marine sediment metagenome]|uniref:Uncharacterized protein n=1 Tax=marine sediment metagenome TaxID=412755 RepID=A0A0F9BUJ8_9ZZZZ